jgi:hypothetical protein
MQFNNNGVSSVFKYAEEHNYKRHQTFNTTVQNNFIYNIKYYP